MMFRNSSYAIHSENNFEYVLVKGEVPFYTPLVLLHGMFGGLSNFDSFIQQMGNERTILVPQIPLYDTESQAINIPKLAEWIKYSIKEKMGFESVILLGNSLGGHIALECAVQDSPWVKGLILTGSSGMLERSFGCSRFRRFDRDYIRDRASMTFYNRIVEEEMVDEILLVLKNRNKLSRLLNIARSARNFSMKYKLRRIKQPTLLIWGKNDNITPPEVALSFKQKLPNATLQWIDQCGHAPMMERPDEFTKSVKSFLEHFEDEIGTMRYYEREKSYS